MGWELEDVEKLFVAQLQGLNWEHTERSLDIPAVTGRSSFSEVIQRTIIKTAQKLAGFTRPTKITKSP